MQLIVIKQKLFKAYPPSHAENFFDGLRDDVRYRSAYGVHAGGAVEGCIAQLYH